MRSKLLAVDPKTLQLTVLPELLVTEPFRSLVKRDKGREKTRSIRELSWIWLFYDPRSPYYSLDSATRMAELDKALFDSAGFEPDPLVKACAQAYMELRVSELERLFGAAVTAVSRLENFFSTFDASLEEDPALSVSRVIASLGKLGEVSAGLSKLKEAVAKEDELKGSIRRGVETNQFNE